MFRIIFTILLVGAFFILFFKPGYSLKNKGVIEPEASTTYGFIEDTRDAFIHPMYPTSLMHRDETGKNKNKYGNIGTFVPHSSVPENHWLQGFPHKSDDTIEIPDETPEEKLERRLDEIKYT